MPLVVDTAMHPPPQNFGVPATAGDGRVTVACRVLCAILLLTLLANRQAADDALQGVWSSASQHWLVRHDTFEPLVATAGFAIAINAWRLVDRFHIIPDRYRLDVRSGGQESKDGGAEKGGGISSMQFTITVAAYLLPLAVFDSVFARRKLPEQAPTCFGVLAGVLCSLITYDFLFFWLHCAMHKASTITRGGSFSGAAHFLRKSHREHHAKTGPLHAGEVVRHSLVDGSLQVVCNIVALNLLRLHPLTRCFHNVVITYLLTECHSGFDCPWMPHRVLPGGVLGGSPRHEEHHRVGNRFFQQFGTWLDDSEPLSRWLSRWLY